MRAPARSYSASGMLEASPAPASTKTRWPARVSSLTACGARATRLSPGVSSLTTPILTRAHP
jgi:hypothetical protein